MSNEKIAIMNKNLHKRMLRYATKKNIYKPTNRFMNRLEKLSFKPYFYIRH